MTSGTISRWIIGAAILCLAAVTAPVVRSDEPWTPRPPIYGMHVAGNVEVTMSDGQILRANVGRPADLETGEPVTDDDFPVLLTMTPYGKADPNEYLVARGYIHVVADDRGHGTSQGVHDGRGIQDAVDLVHWAAALDGSTGEVGTTGCSALGAMQLRLAAAIGPDSPLKATFVDGSYSSVYRDLLVPGGIPSIFFQALGGAIVPAGDFTQPVLDYTGDPGDTTASLVQRPAYAGFYFGNMVASQLGSESSPYAYYTEYWDGIDPWNRLDQVVANDVPTFLAAGWNDIVQQGPPKMFGMLQNAAAGRAMFGSMVPGQEVSGKYQLLMGPWGHCGYTGGPAGSDVDYNALQLRWFDRWLHDDLNGIDETTNPVHVWEAGANRWIDTDVWPLTDATTYYLDGGPSDSGALAINDGTLAPVPPTDPAAADPLVWNGATPTPCQVTVSFFPETRCTNDDRPNQTGPNVLSYTVDAGGKTLAGPSTATVYLTSTSPDAEIVAALSDVAPDGTSVPITGGLLLGSFREIDPERSWFDTSGKLVVPHHRYTSESQVLIEGEEVARLDIEIRPIVWKFGEGHKLRLTIQTSAAPWSAPSAAQMPNLAGGVYQVQRNRAHASSINLPLLDSIGFESGCSVCIAPGA